MTASSGAIHPHAAIVSKKTGELEKLEHKWSKHFSALLLVSNHSS
jgi:hypothetical protein